MPGEATAEDRQRGALLTVKRRDVLNQSELFQLGKGELDRFLDQAAHLELEIMKSGFQKPFPISSHSPCVRAWQRWQRAMRFSSLSCPC